MRQWLIASLSLCLWASSALAIDPLPFRDAAEEDRFRALTAELRCVMCQNQSLADSNAMIAGDLRKEVFELMQAGKSDDEIKSFLTERYTDFVLYDPPLQSKTWLLWFSPVVILLAGSIVVALIVRRRAADASASPVPPNDEEW
ncbi:MAG: cytochrome c-type biogenesis protein CcmH [Xanthomonadales bacterium]|nr:cytochrome c-type biogenesis protein CcmH [Xanthomonadales bacterium]